MIMKLLSDAHFVHAGQGERRMSPVTIQILQLQVLYQLLLSFHCEMKSPGWDH